MYVSLLEANRGIPSYELFKEQKYEIETILSELHEEVRKQPGVYHQIRNRTPHSITKRYLYLTDPRKLSKCLSDAKKLLAKYRS